MTPSRLNTCYCILIGWYGHLITCCVSLDATHLSHWHDVIDPYHRPVVVGQTQLLLITLIMLPLCTRAWSGGSTSEDNTLTRLVTQMKRLATRCAPEWTKPESIFQRCVQEGLSYHEIIFTVVTRRPQTLKWMLVLLFVALLDVFHRALGQGSSLWGLVLLRHPGTILSKR